MRVLRHVGLLAILAAALFSGIGPVLADEDGKTLAAKPGMARLYLIQGDLVRGPVPIGPGADGKPDFYVSGTVWDGSTTVYGSGPMAVGVLAGALIGSALREPEAPPAEMTRLKPLVSPTLFYLDHKKVAEPKAGEYAAADIAPGQYELKLCFGLRDCVVRPLEVAEGQVVYMVGDADMPNGPILEVCHQDCGDRVLQGHQIDAFPKPGSNIPNF